MSPIIPLARGSNPLVNDVNKMGSVVYEGCRVVKSFDGTSVWCVSNPLKCSQ